MAKYFEGKSVYGQVKESIARSFSDVVDVLRICPTLGIAHGAYLALPKEKRDEIKHVPYFIAAVCRTSPSDRLLERAIHCNLLMLDLDEEKDGSCPATPFVKNPASLYTALEGYNFAAYTTASSTPEKPRMRIVVDADKIPIAKYGAAVATIAALLGLARITTESKRPIQPMFLPTLFSDSEDFDHPLIAHRVDVGTFRESDIEDDAVDRFKVQHVIKADGGTVESLDGLDFLRAPIPEITLSIAKEALSHVNPDCEYHEWLDMAAALRHQFSPHKAEEAYEIFDEWSETGAKYPGDEGTRRKWDSLRPSPQGRLPKTIRTLLARAVQAGWDDKKVKESCFNALIHWFEEVPTVIELIEHGVKKILATPLLTAVQEDILVHQLCSNAKKRFAYTISATAIRKDITRTKAEIKAQEKPEETKKEPMWARGVCFVSQTNQFFRHRTGELYKPDAFNANYSRWLLPSEDGLKAAGIPVTPATLSRPVISPADFALNHLKITTVYDFAYDPSQPTDVFFVDRGRRLVNTYSPTYPEPDNKHAAEAGRIFQDHLSVLVAQPAYRAIITDFLAYMVQFPGRKIRWAPLIQSVEGAGKTFLAEAAKAVLGIEHVYMLSGEAIKSGYNEWATGYQLLALEEVRVAGANRREVMNALKPLITNDVIPVTQKFRDTRQVANISNYMLFSNHHDALALTPGDRRYFVVKSPLQSKSQVLALGENYFPPLYNMLRDLAGALRAYLDQWQISPTFRPDGHAPRTVYIQELINDSASDLTASIRRLLLEGDYSLIQYDIVSAKQIMDVLHLEEGMHRVTSQAIGQVLREEGFTQIGRHAFGEDRHYIWARSGVNFATAVDVAHDRFFNGDKNLCMELIFP